ncbi:hypothetical protein F2Q69_00003295 [Brassica cretica]|uniref:Uncharacterized protein n=1 Tax=Brassica cretica TaxID=69181 RepID=A0A8S9NXQ6_BRACR|nr:hypothetical protein F2Q69_00003295 [Brassica cretica]
MLEIRVDRMVDRSLNGSTKKMIGWTIWMESSLRNLILLEPGRFKGIRELPWDLLGCFICADFVHSLIGKELLDINVGLLHIRQVEVQEDSPNPVGAGVAKDVLDVFWVFGQLMQTGLISWFDCDPPDPVWHGAS